MKVFTTGQVAKICKVAPRTVSKWFDSGRLRGYRIPGSQDRRIPREHLIKFLKEHGMPLGELEEEGLHKILIIGADKLFIDRVKEMLPKDAAYEQTLIIALASEDEASPESLTNYGFNEAFKKPFDVALLAERIRTIV